MLPSPDFMAHLHGAIARAEQSYQTRTEPRTWPPLRLLVRGLLWLSLALALILSGGEFFGVLLLRDPSPIATALRGATVLPIMAAVGLHFALMFQTLARSSNSMAREQIGGTWDLLILSNVDGRQIVWGKWWATVRRMARAYVLLAALRAAVIIWIGASTSRTLVMLNTYYYHNSEAVVILPSALNFPLAALLIVALTLANLGFTAACGVAAAAIEKPGALVLARAIGLRLASVILAVLGLGVFICTFSTSRMIFDLDTGLSSLAITLLDNGFSSGYALVSYQMQWLQQLESRDAMQSAVILLMTMIGLGIYGVMTWMLMNLAETRTVRRLRALPAPRTSSTAR